MAIEQIPTVGALFIAPLIQTALAASKLRLIITGYTPVPGDTLADLVAVEATFTGYTTGGYALTTWNTPVIDPAGGVSITSLQVQPAIASPYTVGNTLGGWFLVDATGNLVADGLFDTPIPLTQAGDGFPITVKLYFGTTNQLVGASVYGGAQ